MPPRLMRLAMIVGPLLLCTVLPIWTCWYIGPWEATGEWATLWSALGMVPRNVRMVGFFDFAFQYSMTNFVTAGLLLLVGFGVERSCVTRRRSQMQERGGKTP